MLSIFTGTVFKIIAVVGVALATTVATVTTTIPSLKSETVPEVPYVVEEQSEIVPESPVVFVNTEEVRLRNEQHCKSLIRNININYWNVIDTLVERVNCEEFGITTVAEKFKSKGINYAQLRNDLTTVAIQSKDNSVHFWKRVLESKHANTDIEKLRHYCTTFPKKRFTVKNSILTSEEKDFSRFCLGK